MFTIDNLPTELFELSNASIFNGILRGCEREALRVTPNGALALSEHPKALGSALTHPQITTDFSEALLEFITPPSHKLHELFGKLETIQAFTYKQLREELIWTNSMPCSLPADLEIPVANYGHSNNGKMKTAYRIGLGHRYGRTMQTVAGVHYNFSLPDCFWALLSDKENQMLDLRSFKNEKYFGLIRNFRRHYWLLIYLFGASPALCRSFVRNKSHNLVPFNDDPHTLHLPYATSLRMGDLGYQSSAQENLYVCYNDQNSYIKTLCKAITTAHPEYEAIGLKDQMGQFKQLNTSLLQIENEFYSSIRPKRTAKAGETALAALNNRGVEYIEVRCLDINPFDPLGISIEQAYFLDTFLVYCALQNSPMTDQEESAYILENQKSVVREGRNTNLMLHHKQHGKLSLHTWGTQLLEGMKPVAEMLDLANQCDGHSKSLEAQRLKLEDPDLTPSGQILNTLKKDKITFAQYALKQSQKHKETLTNHTLTEEQTLRMTDMVKKSLQEQIALEDNEESIFDEFLSNYFQQYTCCSK